MLKVGVIGVGAMGRHHARIYSELSGVEFIGVADVNIETAQRVAAEYNTRAFSDYHDLFTSDVQAISICVPTSLHERVALDALRHKAHVLIEKPIAATLDEADRIISTAYENGVKLQVGLIERFNPVISTVKKAIEGESVVSIDIIRVGPHPPRVKDVGVVIDIGTHDIDLISYLTQSDFEEVHAVVAPPTNGFEDAATLSFKMINGTIASINTNRITPFKIREIKIATPTKLIYGNLLSNQVSEYSHYTVDYGTYEVRHPQVPFEEPLKLELKSFVDSVVGNTKPVVTGEDGRLALEIALQCIKNNR